MDEQATSAVAAPGVPPAATPGEGPARPAGRRHLLGWSALALIVLVGAGAYVGSRRGKSALTLKIGSSKAEGRSPGGIPVEVAQPRRGGIERTTAQAGSVHAFEHASLYAKVSGYLKEQAVDIGDRVKVGQLLATIDVPELDEAVEQAAALEQARARVEVAEARVRGARADKEAADALVRQSEAEVDAKSFNNELRRKQLARIRGLVERNAVEAKLQDEQKDRLDVAASELGVARAAVLTTRAQAIAKAAQVESAQADLAEARANVSIAEANLGRAKVMQDYTRITSP